MIVEIDTKTLDETLAADDGKLSVVMFYGASCGPCKATMPHFENTAEYYQSKNAPINFYRLHAWESDESKEYCREKWSVNGVPNFKLLFKQTVVATREGGGELNVLKKLVHDGIDEVFKQFDSRL